MYKDKFAIVAMALKFPGANNLEQFWDIIKNGKETLSSFSMEQSISAGIEESVLASDSYRPYRGILDNLDLFQQPVFENKASDFNALSMQAKVMSHLTHQALTSIEGNIKDPIKNTALFMGTSSQLVFHGQDPGVFRPISTRKIIENYYLRTIAPYIAYEHGFQGAAIDLYTACSSSGVAVIQACKELSLNQCDMAIAGGISINLPQEVGYLFTENGILSDDGHCRPFDISASGTVMSNGAGLIVLKRYEDALANNDFIHAVIIGYGMNNDANLKTGFMAPGINGQYSCIHSAWKNAGIQPNDLDYIETHGTATQLGDPIEIYALKKACQSFNMAVPCPVGSVKSNIGHTIIASGMAAIIKTVLMLQHKSIVPSINFQTLNPNILLEETPLYIATNYQEFAKTKKYFTAGVSNFGLGGTNTHIVLQTSY